MYFNTTVYSKQSYGTEEIILKTLIKFLIFTESIEIDTQNVAAKLDQ